MTTQADFQSQLRLRLNDPTKARWSDSELAMYLAESTSRYSKLFPRLREQEFAPDGVSSRFAVPDDLIDNKIHEMWVIADEVMYEIPGGVLKVRRPERYFDVVGAEIVLNFIPRASTTVRVRYSALYIMPATGEAMMPSEDEDLIYLWAEHLAWRKIGGSDASLSRWKESGNRDDGPIIPHYVMLERQYNRMVEEKKAGGRFLVRVRAARTSRYYYTD